jgi:hypothetical protein
MRPLSVFLLYAHVLKINEGSIFIRGREGESGGRSCDLRPMIEYISRKGKTI